MLSNHLLKLIGRAPSFKFLRVHNRVRNYDLGESHRRLFLVKQQTYFRLLTCCLMGPSEDWVTERNCLKEEKIVTAVERRYQLREIQVAF